MRVQDSALWPIRRWFQVMGCTVGLVLALFAEPCRAQSANLSPGQFGQLLREGSPAALRAFAEQPIPPMLHQHVGGFASAQFIAARRIGDMALAEQVLRRWVEQMPGDPDAGSTLWRYLSLGGAKVTEAISIGRKLIAQTRSPSEEVMWRSWLADDLISTGQIREAPQILEGLAEVVDTTLARQSSAGSGAFWKSMALGAYHQVNAKLRDAQQNSEAASTESRRAVDAFLAAVSRGTDVSQIDRQNAAFYLVMSYAYRADMQSTRGEHFSAERTLDEGASAIAAHPVELATRIVIDLQRLKIRNRQERFVGVVRLADELLARLALARLPTNSRTVRAIRSEKQIAMLGLERYQDAVDDFETQNVELRKAGNTSLWHNMTARAVAYIKVERGAYVHAKLGQHLEFAVKGYPPGHPQIALFKGLHALALKQAGLSRFDEPDQDLTEAARALAGIELDYGMDTNVQRRLARRLILQGYLDSLDRDASSSEAAEAFRIVEILRSSSVQAAIHQAAARGAVKDPRLATMVRRSQDVTRELLAVYAALDRLVLEQDESAEVQGLADSLRERSVTLARQQSELSQQVVKEFPEYQRLARGENVSPEDIVQRLQAGEAYLTLVPSSHGVHAWWFSKQGALYRFSRTTPGELATWTAAIRQSIDIEAAAGSPLPPFPTDAAAKLYGKLLGAFETEFPPTKHLIIAAGDSLASIPFAALLTGPWDGLRSAAAPWLIRRFALSQTAGASAWLAGKRLAGTPQAPEPLLAWGDPSFERSSSPKAATVRHLDLEKLRQSVQARDTGSERSFYGSMPPLPETRDELRSIAAALGSDPSMDLVLGEDATRTNVLTASESGRMARKRVIAFATHGLMAGDLPNLTQPALAMAALPDSTEQPLRSLLTLEDILGLRLNTDWVVLSACNTAASDGKAQEALSGLARGFFFAGARSLLVTQWAVETKSATLLTTGTFNHYAADPSAGKAESLRQAILLIITGYPRFGHPAYWAPYILVGDGGR